MSGLEPTLEEAREAFRSLRRRNIILAGCSVWALGFIFYSIFSSKETSFISEELFVDAVVGAFVFWIWTEISLAKCIRLINNTGTTASRLWLVSGLLLGPLGAAIVVFVFMAKVKVPSVERT